MLRDKSVGSNPCATKDVRYHNGRVYVEQGPIAFQGFAQSNQLPYQLFLEMLSA